VRGSGRDKGDRPQVVSITGAPRSHSDDLDRRISRYLTSMAIRTVCVILVVVIDSPVRWVFGVGAVVLPYIAVVMANARGDRYVPPAPVTPPAARGAIADGVADPRADHRSETHPGDAAGGGGQ
jgi:hypothetical protein